MRQKTAQVRRWAQFSYATRAVDQPHLLDEGGENRRTGPVRSSPCIARRGLGYDGADVVQSQMMFRQRTLDVGHDRPALDTHPSGVGLHIDGRHSVQQQQMLPFHFIDIGPRQPRTHRLQANALLSHPSHELSDILLIFRPMHCFRPPYHVPCPALELLHANRSKRSITNFVRKNPLLTESLRRLFFPFLNKLFSKEKQVYASKYEVGTDNDCKRLEEILR